MEATLFPAVAFRFGFALIAKKTLLGHVGGVNGDNLNIIAHHSALLTMIV